MRSPRGLPLEGPQHGQQPLATAEWTGAFDPEPPVTSLRSWRIGFCSAFKRSGNQPIEALIRTIARR